MAKLIHMNPKKKTRAKKNKKHEKGGQEKAMSTKSTKSKKSKSGKGKGQGGFALNNMLMNFGIIAGGVTAVILVKKFVMPKLKFIPASIQGIVTAGVLAAAAYFGRKQLKTLAVPLMIGAALEPAIDFFKTKVITAFAGVYDVKNRRMLPTKLNFAGTQRQLGQSRVVIANDNRAKIPRTNLFSGKF